MEARLTSQPVRCPGVAACPFPLWTTRFPGQHVCHVREVGQVLGREHSLPRQSAGLRVDRYTGIDMQAVRTRLHVTRLLSQALSHLRVRLTEEPTRT